MSALAARLPRDLLGASLRLDAVVSAANGAAYLALAEPIGDLLGLSPALLRGVGGFLLAYAACVWLVARTRRGVAAIIAGNVVWAAGSLVAAIAGWGDPTAVGTAWIAAQGLVVGAFAELQVTGLRRR